MVLKSAWSEAPSKKLGTEYGQGEAFYLPYDDTYYHDDGTSHRYNEGKLTQTCFCISIRSYFRPRKSDPEKLQNDKKEMVRSWVEVSNYQYEQLKKLKEKTGRPLSEMIREAVSGFVRKKDHPMSIAASYLPKASRDQHKNIISYFPRCEWHVLIDIWENTRRSKTDLIREAVEEYLRESQ